MTTTMQQLLAFLCRLESSKISYRLEHNREEAIMVLLSVPGERWEVEFLQDGSIEVEIFTSDGRMHQSDALERLFQLQSDQ